MGLMMHTADGEYVTRHMIQEIPLPAETETYKPVANGEFVEMLLHEADKALGLPLVGEKYGLSQRGQQMFGVLTFDTGNPDHGLGIGFRNSYNKTLPGAVAGGVDPFVCDNLCFSGDSFTVVRRHTKNVWADLRVMIQESMGGIFADYSVMCREFGVMREIDIDQDTGYEVLGLAMGHDVLLPQQASYAMKAWQDPPQEAFEGRNIYSLYNAFTEGTKRGAAGAALDTLPKVHAFFRENLPQLEEVRVAA
jgi:hypothetical protein